MYEILEGGGNHVASEYNDYRNFDIAGGGCDERRQVAVCRQAKCYATLDNKEVGYIHPFILAIAMWPIL